MAASCILLHPLAVLREIIDGDSYATSTGQSSCEEFHVNQSPKGSISSDLPLGKEGLFFYDLRVGYGQKGQFDRKIETSHFAEASNRELQGKDLYN